LQPTKLKKKKERKKSYSKQGKLYHLLKGPGRFPSIRLKINHPADHDANIKKPNATTANETDPESKPGIPKKTYVHPSEDSVI